MRLNRLSKVVFVELMCMTINWPLILIFRFRIFLVQLFYFQNVILV